MSRLVVPDNPFTVESLKTGHVFQETGHAGSQSDTINTIFTPPPIPKPNGQPSKQSGEARWHRKPFARLCRTATKI